MNAIDLINTLRQALGDVKRTGQDVIPIDRLEAYLTEMERIANQDGVREAQETQTAMMTFERDMEVWKVNHLHAIEMFKSVIEAGLNALKSAVIINGGAAAALLAFLGNLLIERPASGTIFSIADVGYALLIFLAGTGFAGTASGTRYLSQAAYARALEDEGSGKPRSCWRRTGAVFQSISIVLGLSSFGAFFYGGWCAYIALITPR